MVRKQMAISVPQELKNDFYETAKQMGTNPSNLITMFMSNIVHTKEFHFKAFNNNFEQEKFSPNELNDLMKEGKNSYDTISSIID